MFSSFLRKITTGEQYTLNFDGSHNNQANKSGAGCIIRDNQGDFKLAASYNLTDETYCNVAIAEAKALLNGLKLAKENNLSINIIRGDSTEVIDYVLNRSRRPAKPPLNGIIKEIIGMINLNTVSIEIVDREKNKVADKLACWETNSRLYEGRRIYTSYFELPTQVKELIQQEKSSDNGEGSSMISNIAKVVGGIAIAGATIAYGLSQLSEESSDNQRRNNANAPWKYDSRNYTSNYSSMGSSRLVLPESSYGYDNAPTRTQNNDFYTINFDGSDINQLQKGGAGCIIRNKERDLVIAAAYNLDHLYPNRINVAIAEAIGLRNGLKLAKNANVKLSLIEGDSKEVIDRVLGRERRPPRVPFLSEIIEEIRVALNDQSIVPETQLKLIDREANKVADELASYGSRLGFGMVKTYEKDDVLTFKLSQLIQKDKATKGVL